MDDTIKAADGRLHAAFEAIGYRLNNVSGVIDGTAVRDNLGRYLFAWHRNPHHLLFYLRGEALKAKSTLRQKALARHSVDQVNRNPGGETTVTLRSDEEAEALLAWLLPTLPLPMTT